MGQMKPRKTNSNGTSSKAKPEASLVEQLGMPLRDFVADFKLHGKSALEQVRLESPSKYLELASKLAALVATLKPPQSAFHDANSMQDIGRKLLESVGTDNAAITEDMIQEAVAANDRLIAQLESIRDKTLLAAVTEGELN
jgi:hypothetical protein